MLYDFMNIVFGQFSGDGLKMYKKYVLDWFSFY